MARARESLINVILRCKYKALKIENYTAEWKITLPLTPFTTCEAT